MEYNATKRERRRLARVQRAVAEAMVRKKVEQDSGVQRDVQTLTKDEPRGIIDEVRRVSLPRRPTRQRPARHHRHRRPPHQARSHADAQSGRHPVVPGGEDGAHRRRRRPAHPRPPPAVRPRARELRHERGRHRHRRHAHSAVRRHDGGPASRQGHVISEASPIITHPAWCAAVVDGADCRPVVNASVSAAIGSGALVLVAYGAQVRRCFAAERLRSLGVRRGRERRVGGLTVYDVARSDDGCGLTVVECEHPSAHTNHQQVYSRRRSHRAAVQRRVGWASGASHRRHPQRGGRRCSAGGAGGGEGEEGRADAVTVSVDASGVGADLGALRGSRRVGSASPATDGWKGRCDRVTGGCIRKGPT